MFRCSECGAEYNEKPEYCDCGNDIFVEIEEQIIPAEKPKKRVKKSFSEMYPWIEELQDRFDPLSVIIFFVCIILSVCLLVFVNPKDNPIAENSTEQNQKITVADIESFWDDTPPNAIPKTYQPAVAKQNEIIVQQEQPNPVQKVIVPTVPKVVTKPKTIVKNNNVQPKTTVKKNSVSQPTVKKQTPQQQPKIQTQVQPPKTQTVTQPKTQTVSQPKTQTQINTTVKKISTPTATSAQELKDYKKNLRNKIAKHINFANVEGDGSCSISFTIDSNGKLVNRKFIKQSNNGTLNDEVYAAFMSTPKYTAPPSSYKGETLTYTVTFKNGNYSISLN